MQSLYENNSNIVRIDRDLHTKEFYNRKGVSDKGVFCHPYYLIHIQNKTMLDEGMRGILIEWYKYSHLRCANDITLIATNFIEMKELVKKLGAIGPSHTVLV